MCPRISKERVMDPLVSAKHTLGTTGLMLNLLVRIATSFAILCTAYITLRRIFFPLSSTTQASITLQVTADKCLDNAPYGYC
jgi:hypothetical protein